MTLPLAKDAFFIPDPDTVYLDGNSLGRPTKEGREEVRKILDHQWPSRLIRGWNEGWIGLPAEAASLLGRVLGAGEDEIVVCDQTSINLYKAVMAALSLRPGRRRIVSDDLQFPSDLYILQGIAREKGLELVLARSRDGATLAEEDLAAVVNDDTAVLCLSLVSYKSGFLWSMESVNRLAHDRGALTVWDLSHAAGAVDVQLGESKADFAVGCTYKFLNGGPGSPGYLYCARRHGAARSPLQGWLGHSAPFAFREEFEGLQGAGRFVVGTPPILSLAPLASALRLLVEAGPEKVAEGNRALCGEFLAIAKADLLPLGFGLLSPEDPAKRGAHISLTHPEGRKITQALVDRGVIPDFRAPDVIRFGFNCLYNGFEDGEAAVRTLRRVMEGRLWEAAALPKGPVT